MRTMLWLWAVTTAILVFPVNARASERRIVYSAAYFGEFLLHPGLVAGLEYPLATTRIGSARGALLVAGNAGAYTHVRNHTGLMLDSEAGYRLTFRSGLLLEGYAGAGYLHTWLAAPVYSVGDDGTVTRVSDAGRPAFMPVLGLGAGWQLERVAPFLRIQAFGQYPFNQHLLPHAALLLGARV